ncbi:MAG: DUF58 domain-containing protein, partial [Actinomycetia bacterium]|nr:DUF58 domain-containing protein [Actinomycetes bacterium]
STVVPGDDPCELYDLRDYQPGDRLSRIHWKLSDKYDRLMVKEYGRVVASDALITFDLNADAPEIDALMDTLCSLASFFREQGQACEVAWYDGVHQAQARAKAASTDEWEALIAAILSGGRAQAAPLVLRELAQDPTRAHFRNLVCLCGELGLAGAELAELRARMAGSDPRIIVLTQENTGRKDGAHELALG